jgi:hypothetical protein
MRSLDAGIPMEILALDKLSDWGTKLIAGNMGNPKEFNLTEWKQRIPPVFPGRRV